MLSKKGKEALKRAYEEIEKFENNGYEDIEGVLIFYIVRNKDLHSYQLRDWRIEMSPYTELGILQSATDDVRNELEDAGHNYEEEEEKNE